MVSREDEAGELDTAYEAELESSPSDSATQTRKTLLRSGVILVAILAAGGLSFVATFSHAASDRLFQTLMAASFSVAATVPAYWFSQAISNGAVKQLGVVLWRVGWLLPPLWFMSQLEGSSKSVFVLGLMACYFVGLTVESAMLIADARRAT